MKIFKLGLIGKIASLVIFIEIVAFGILGWFYSERYSSALVEQTYTRLKQIGKMIANEELPISVIARKSFMSDMLGVPYKEGLIVGGNGIIIVSSESEYLGQYPENITEFNKEWFDKSAPKVKFILKENELISILHFSADDTNEPLYHVFISVSTVELNAMIHKIMIVGFIASLIFIFLSSTAIISIAQRFVAKRINSSLSVLKNIENGNLESRIAIAINDEIGELQRGINSMLDSINKSNKKLKTLTERLSLTWESTNDGLWDWHIKTNKTYFSHSWKSMLGYEDSEIKNSIDSFYELIHKDDKSKIDKKLKLHFQNPQKYPYIIEFRLKCKDGSYKWILARGKVNLDENGTPERMLGSHTDISKSKELERELIELNANLEQKVNSAIEEIRQKDLIIHEHSKRRAMDELLINLAHHWRQPLNTAAIQIQNIEDFLSGGENDNEIIELIEVAVDELINLSKTITELTKFYEKTASREVSIKDGIETAIELSSKILETAGISVDINIDSDVSLYADYGEWVELFSIFFMNVKDIMQKRNIGVAHISIKVINKEREIIIFIEDDVGGIDTKLLPNKLFEAYTTTSFKSRDKGLGLYMAKNIVTYRLEGTISAENSDIGAKFTIRIPNVKS